MYGQTEGQGQNLMPVVILHIVGKKKKKKKKTRRYLMQIYVEMDAYIVSIS